MCYLMVAFKSRTQTTEFLYALRERNILCSLMNTLKEANLGCGLSVKVSYSALHELKNMINRGGYSSFAGVYKVCTECGRGSVSLL